MPDGVSHPARNAKLVLAHAPGIGVAPALLPAPRRVFPFRFHRQAVTVRAGIVCDIRPVDGIGDRQALFLAPPVAIGHCIVPAHTYHRVGVSLLQIGVLPIGIRFLFPFLPGPNERSPALLGSCPKICRINKSTVFGDRNFRFPDPGGKWVGAFSHQARM